MLIQLYLFFGLILASRFLFMLEQECQKKNVDTPATMQWVTASMIVVLWPLVKSNRTAAKKLASNIKEKL